MKNAIQLTTIGEILYHLATKEIVVFNMLDGYGYFQQQGNDITIVIQPNVGSATIAIGNRSMLRKTFKQFYNTEFYVMPGLRADVKRITLLDRIADFFKKE